MWNFVAGFATATLLALPILVALHRRRLRDRPERRQAQETESLASLGTLARGLAHEIRNPLSTMRVTLQLLREDWAVTDTPREERTVRKIEILGQEVQRLEDTLNDFLRYARGPQLNPVRVDLNGVLSDLVAFFEPQTRQHGIRLRCQFDGALPACWIDVDLIKQAVLNIMINAQQSMPDGGELIVTTRHDGDQIILDVIDTGTGIEPEIRGRIFDAYFSVKHTGTGLGLALAKRIIEDHDGRIEVESEMGKGSDFRIILPAALPGAASGERPSEVNHRG